MLSLTSYFDQRALDNTVQVVRQAIKLLKVNVAKPTVERMLEEHPDYPSLLSISDVMTGWKVNNVVIQTDQQELKQFTQPMIVQIEGAGHMDFAVVRTISDDGLVISDSKQPGWKKMTWEDFTKIWNGIVMLLEPAEDAGEANFHVSNSNYRFGKVVLYVGLLFLTGLCMYRCLEAIFTEGILGWKATAVLLLKVTGVCVTTLLLWYEQDSQNPVLQKICKVGGKGNCNIVLQSMSRKVFGILSWSEVGFIYFGGALLNILISGMPYHLLASMAWANILALPFTIFSIYYQWRVAKQWCMLCLIVQCILIAEFLVSLLSPVTLFTEQLTYSNLNIFVFFTVTALGWLLIKPTVRLTLTAKQTSRQLSRLKRNSRVFESLLLQQRLIPDPGNLGIKLGNPNGKYKLVKVCSPFCGPCAMAHPELIELLDQNPGLQVEIVFNVRDLANDPATAVVKHLLNITGAASEIQTRQVLKDWYGAPVKDYDTFVAQYPLKEGIEISQEQLQAMAMWCKQVGIKHTPTYFLQGHELPEIYQLNEIKYLLIG